MMPSKSGYGIEWKFIKGPRGSNIRIYTRNCDWCQKHYEGRGEKFCGKRCAAFWGRSTKDYSKAAFAKGLQNPIHTHVNSFFESSLEKRVRTFFDLLEVNYVHPYWLTVEGWNRKQYDFFIPEFNLLIEVDGEYWHSRPENVINDSYKNDLAAAAGKDIVRFREKELSFDLIKKTIDLRRGGHL